MKLLNGLTVVALALIGCQPAKFIRTDNNFIGVPRSAPPTVWVDAPPPTPFHRVGEIQVEMGGESAEHELVDAALKLGQQVGCDVLVDSRLAGAAGRFPGDGWIILAHEEGGSVERSARTPSLPAKCRTFVCGVLVPPATT